MPDRHPGVGPRLDNPRVAAGLGATARRIAADLPAGDGVGVLLVLGFGFVVAGSNAFADGVVAAQAEVEEGPGLAAAVGGTAVRATDLAGERRWPLLASAADGLGLGAALSVPLRPGADLLGSVSVYARGADDLVRLRESAVLEVASHVLGELETTRWLGRLDVQVSELLQAFDDRCEIDIAVGVLVARRGLGVEEARAALRRLALRDGRSLVRAAREVIRSTTDHE